MTANFEIIAGLFETETRNLMKFNKHSNPFLREAIRNHYCEAISEMIKTELKIN